jgi:hypothetical protein
MEQWMNGINSHAGNVRAPGLTSSVSYTTDGYVTQYGKNEDPLKTYRLVGMFPIDIAPIDLDWGANDQIEEYAITFAYQWWESDSTDGAGGPINPMTLA